MIEGEFITDPAWLFSLFFLEENPPTDGLFGVQITRAPAALPVDPGLLYWAARWPTHFRYRGRETPIFGGLFFDGVDYPDKKLWD